jgi:hypothetical protein
VTVWIGELRRRLQHGYPDDGTAGKVAWFG